MKRTHCVYIALTPEVTNQLVDALNNLGYCVHGEKLKLGEFGIYVETDDEFGVPFSTLEKLTKLCEEILSC